MILLQVLVTFKTVLIVYLKQLIGYIGSKAIEHTINTWSSFKNKTTIDFDKFYNSTDEEGKPRKWWTAKCDGIDYPPMSGFNRLVFFRADEIPTFILTRKSKYKTYEGIVLP